MDLIQSAPDHLVRATLIALCSDRSQLAKAKDYLSKMGHIAATPATDNSLKRKAEDEVKICVQCQEPYYEADNIGEGSCKYHNGVFHLSPTYRASLIICR